MKNLFKDYFTLQENQVVKLKLKGGEETIFGTFQLLSRMYGADKTPNEDKFPGGTFAVIKDFEAYRKDKTTRTFEDKRQLNEEQIESIEIVEL
jgi:hypothetical protein